MLLPFLWKMNQQAYFTSLLRYQYCAIQKIPHIPTVTINWTDGDIKFLYLINHHGLTIDNTLNPCHHSIVIFTITHAFPIIIKLNDMENVRVMNISSPNYNQTMSLPLVLSSHHISSYRLINHLSKTIRNTIAFSINVAYFELSQDIY